MRAESVALNYAEALFALADRAGGAGDPVAWGDLMRALADAIALSPGVDRVLMSPKVPKAAKADLLAASLPAAPKDFVLFLRAVVKRGRQGMFAEIARQYGTLVDQKLGRTRASVLVAREPDQKLRDTIVQALTRATGKEVIATFMTDPSILGGAIVRVEDRVLDGSVRRRMTRLRRQLVQR